MATRIQLRRGNANAWLSTNPILSSGELGLELDTNRFKIGDSSNTWANLAYFSPEIGTTSNLAEGANLYFTNTRAVGAFSQGSGIVIAANGLISSTALGGVTSVNGSNGNVQLFYTSNTEPVSNTLGTFWYKPDEGNIFIKVNDGSANIWLEIDTPFFSYTANTTDVVEGANLYFTNTRAVAALTSGAGISIASNGLLTVTVTGGGGGGSGNGNITAVAGVTEGAVSNVQLANAVYSTGIFTTSNVVEGSNLYFTNARSIGAMTAGAGMIIHPNGLMSVAVTGNILSIAGVLQGDVSNAQLSAALVNQNVTVNNLTITQSLVGNLDVNGNINVDGNLVVNGKADLNGNFNVVGNVNVNGNINARDIRVGNIIVEGNIVPTVNEVFSLGTPALKFKDLFLSGNTIVLGETKLQSDPTGGFSISSSNVEQTGSISFSTAANAALISEVITSNVITVDSVTANTWSGIYTANVVETSGNLYFTNTRAISALSGGRGVEIAANGLITSLYNIESIAGVANGVVSNIQIAFAIQDTALLNTANIIEGGNLYYTNARVAANVATLGYAPNAYVNTRLLTKANVSEITPLASNSHVTAVVNLLQTTKANNEDVTNLTTANIPEGGNLYFTNTRAVSAIYTDDSLILDANGRLIANIAAVGGGTITSVAGINFGGVSNVQLAAALVDRTVNLANITVTETASINQLRVTGDMSVTGTTTFINTTEVAINDKNLVLANGSASAATSDGAGISISGAFANLTYYSGPNRFNLNRYLDVQGNTVLTNANTTTHLTEGTNLYFTNTRAVGAFTATAGVNLAANGLLSINQGNIATIASLNVTPATIDLDVGLIGGRYNIQPYLGSNPPIKAFAGQTLAFDLGAGLGIASHPFTIKNNYSDTNVTSGLSLVTSDGTLLTGAAAQGNIAGRLLWRIPPDIGGNTYVYQSTSNANVYGNIIIYSIGSGGSGDVLTVNGSNGNVILYYTSNTAPNANTLGTLWYKPDEGNIYFYVNDGTSNIWLEIDQGGSVNEVTSVNGETGAVVLTTANIAESGNLYFTNNRVQLYLGNVSGNIVPSANETYSLGSPTNKWKDLYLSGNTIILGNTKLESAGDGSLSIKSTNAEVTSAISFASNGLITSEAGNYTTANIAEQGNLYYTNARARAALSSGTGVNYNSSTGAIAISQNVDITANVTFQNLLVTGNLTVTGNTVTISTTSLAIEDNMIYLNSNSEVTNPDLGFAGNYNDGSYRHAGLFRDATDGVWKFFDNYQPEPDASPYIDTSNTTFRLSNVQVTNLIGNVTGRITSLDNHTTSNLIEGANLYFTNTRSIGALTSGSGISIAANGLITSTALGGVQTVNGENGDVELYYTSNTAPSSPSIGSIWFRPSNANLYVYVNDGLSNIWLEVNTDGVGGSAVTSVFGSVGTISNLQLACAVVTTGVLNTNNVIEGANLYFTNTRAIGALTAGTGISIAANGMVISNASGSMTPAKTYALSRIF